MQELKESKTEPGRRFDAGKRRYDLVPVRPLEDIADVYTKSCKENGGKYDARNWEKGMSWTRVGACLERHLMEWKKGNDLDPEDGLKHMAKVAWNALAILEYMRTKPELDDRAKVDAKHMILRTEVSS